MPFTQADVKEFLDFRKFKEAAQEAQKEETPPEVRSGAVPPAPAKPAPQPESQQVRDPNAERWAGAGAQIMTRAQPNADMEERRWQEAEGHYGPALRAARIFRAAALAKWTGAEGKQDDALCRALSDMMGDVGTARYVEELYTREASSQVPKAGGFLVPMEASSEIIRIAHPYMVLPDLGVRVLTVESGTLTLDKQTSDATAKWGFENKPVHLSDVPEFGQITWQTKRLDTSMVFSKELIRRARYDVDQLFRDILGAAYGAKVEYSFINGAGQKGEIVGILAHPDLTDVPIGAKLDEKNLYKFKQKLRKTNMALLGNAKWLFNEDHEYALQTYENATSGKFPFMDEMDGGTLKRRPYCISQNIPTGSGSGKPSTVFFGDFSQYWVVREGSLEVDASDKVPYEDNDGNVKSAWSRHQVAIKMLDWLDMQPRDGRLILRSSDAKTE